MERKRNIIIAGFIVLGLIIIGLILVIIFKREPSNSTVESIDKETSDIKEIETEKTEFNTSMEYRYSDILNQYFDMNYITLLDYKNLAKYPDAYKDVMIKAYGTVVKVLEEQDKNYKILLEITGEKEFYYGTSRSENYLVIEGEYKKSRFMPGEDLVIFGVYKGNDTYKVNNSNEVIPKVNAVRVLLQGATGETVLFDEEDLREIAKEFFGTTFTISKPMYDGSTDVGLYLMSLPFHYIVTLDNNSNARFNKFRLYTEYGLIEPATEQDSQDVIRQIEKTSDNEEFLLSTYTKSNDYLELQRYDKDFKQIWTRQFSKAGKYLFINNNERISLAIDNELYFIDEKTGENIIDSIIIPETSAFSLLSNGDVILVTTSAKDFVLYITSNGTIKWKSSLSSYNGEHSNKIEMINRILIGNDKIYVSYYSDYANLNSYVAVFDKNGNEIIDTASSPE